MVTGKMTKTRQRYCGKPVWCLFVIFKAVSTCLEVTTYNNNRWYVMKGSLLN